MHYIRMARSRLFPVLADPRNALAERVVFLSAAITSGQAFG